VQPYKNELDAKMNRIIGYAKEEFNNADSETGESTLGNFVADLLLIESREIYAQPVDLAIINHRGGLRTPILKGAITVQNIFELMPFENEIWLMKIDGEKTLQLFDNAAAKKSNVIAGASYTINENNKAENIMIGEKPFDITKSYIISISDYLAGGGGGHDFLKGISALADNDILCRDMILNYIEKVSGQTGDTLVPALDNRVILKK